MDVYLEKTGMADDTPEDKNREFLLELGTQLEPVIANLYERETGKHLQQPSPARWQHREHPVLMGTPDRLVLEEQRGVELKSENQFQNEFGEPGTDQVPYHYLIQCAHYMAIGEVAAWDIAVLHGGSKFSIYTLHRDQELEKFMIDELLRWWDEHIVRGVVPEVDSSDAWKVYLRKKYPVNTLPILDSDKETYVNVQKLLVARHYVESWETEKTELENQLKLLIGEHEGIHGDFGKITWRKSKDSKTTDYSVAFEWLARKTGTPPDVRAQILNQFTQIKPGTRRFLVSEKKGWLHGLSTSDREAQLPGDVAALQAGDCQSTPETS